MKICPGRAPRLCAQPCGNVEFEQKLTTSVPSCRAKKKQKHQELLHSCKLENPCTCAQGLFLIVNRVTNVNKTANTHQEERTSGKKTYFQFCTMNNRPTSLKHSFPNTNNIHLRVYDLEGLRLFQPHEGTHHRTSSDELVFGRFSVL